MRFEKVDNFPVLSLSVVVLLSVSFECSSSQVIGRGGGLHKPTLKWIRFLVAVNDTWGSCIETVSTGRLLPDKKWNETERILVGRCDSGPLTYGITDIGTGKWNVNLTFYSSVIEDASPPTCQITWSGAYLVPKKPGNVQSLLPGCFTMESREGYHMTSYWFYLLDWYFE